MDELELANKFDHQRPQLRAVASRILGSLSEADDAVQEMWLRLRRSDAEIFPNEHEAVLADSVGIAMQVALDTLSPAERLAFVLHDTFAVPFDEIAAMVDRPPEPTRQHPRHHRLRGNANGNHNDAGADHWPRPRGLNERLQADSTRSASQRPRRSTGTTGRRLRRQRRCRQPFAWEAAARSGSRRILEAPRRHPLRAAA